MSFIEGIGDDLLYVFGFFLFICIVILAWLSTYVQHIQLSNTLFVIEQRIHQINEEEESERASPVLSLNTNYLNEQTILSPSINETLTEHESDIELSEVDEIELNVNEIQSSQINNRISNESISQENQSLRIIIKFLNETQKTILANQNDTISKIKRLYFADELANNKIIRFIYQGRELQDSETLHTYNIRDQTIIHCQITTRNNSTSNQINDRISPSHINTNGIDTSPINISLYFILFLTLIIGSIWYLRIKYRVLFTPISTIILILITIIFFIFTWGSLLPTRQQISDRNISTHIQHIHLD